jgi:molybdenum cofactor synthesis domain-containing protein
MTVARQAVARAVIIGNEILSGKIVDTNTPFLIGALREAGIRLDGVEIVPDDVQRIAAAIQRGAHCDLVVTTGGVGPTHDDVTIAGIASAFGLPIVQHPDIVALIQRFKRADDAALLRVANVPEGAELIWAEGAHWPVIRTHNTFAFPGIPRLFEGSLGAVTGRFAGVRVPCTSVYIGVYESELVCALEEVLALFPGVELGSYPRVADEPWRVKVTVEHPDANALQAAVAHLQARLPDGALLGVEVG